ncbi:TPA: DUF1617 family protein, partial [Streptococcus pyogenes]|nr:DUF1617 family protein [Streptococcus pyogenes]
IDNILEQFEESKKGE